MKRIILALSLLIVGCALTFAKPLLTRSKYLIATLYDGAEGTVRPGADALPLVYKPNTEAETARDSDYWVIKNTVGNEYTFQNAVTLKYIKYDASAADKTALTLVDAPAADKSTSFTLELTMSNNLCYYVIRSVANTAKTWDRATQKLDTEYPLGVSSATAINTGCFIFYDSQGNAVLDDKRIAVNLPKATRTLGAFSTYISSLTFDGKAPVVDTPKKEFYLTIPEAKMGSDLTVSINCKMKSSAYKLYINNTEVVSGASFYFRYVSGTDKQIIEIRNGTTVVVSGNIVFSCLPLVQIYSDATIGTVYSLDRVAITEPQKTDTAEILLTHMRTRGAYSGSLPKKAYAVKLVDLDAATAIDRTFFGLRGDNNWILDAMYIDPGRMRNRTSTDLWNDFSTRPYFAASEPTMVNGTRGQFVEVFLNDSYNGLYCMTEKVDRKQLKLKKLKYNADSTVVTQRGALFKSDDWSVGTLLGNSVLNYLCPMVAYSNASETWCRFEVKYPDLGDGEPVSWKPLSDAINVSIYTTSDAVFKANVANYFDLPVFLDYYLFIELMLAADNHGKNTYLSVYDQTVSPKMTVSPWDMDATWGRRWDGSSNVTVANQNFDTYVGSKEFGQNYLFYRLKSLNLDAYTTKLKTRYKELRGTYFSYTNLMARFQRYCKLFTVSGANAREMSKWAIKDINLEMTFLSTWITARLSYLDNQYLGGTYSAVADVSEKSIRLAPNPVRSQLTISDLSAGDKVQLISLQGQVLHQSISDGRDLTLDMNRYASGVYLVRVGGVTSKVVKE